KEEQRMRSEERRRNHQLRQRERAWEFIKWSNKA
ncbi:unnamed protein product, partial [Didymodactylos carnosus]